MTAQTKPRLAAQFLPLEINALCATPGALDAVGGDAQKFLPLLDRHAWGDWGDVCTEDQTTNNAAAIDGSRIISAYPIDPAKPCKGWGDNCIWIITDAADDNGRRHTTTILLPSEY
jgi:hypothetical protein